MTRWTLPYRLKNWRKLLSYLFISVENISKQQLPSPLGHLNFAMRVILQRHSFMSGFWNWLPLFQTYMTELLRAKAVAAI